MNNLTPIEQRICESVGKRISHQRIVRTRFRAGLYGFFLMTALVALGPSIQYVGERAISSGFTEYMSLITDGSNLSGSWSDLLMSLLESLPLAGIIVSLTCVTVLAFCAQKIISGRLIFAPHSGAYRY